MRRAAQHRTGHQLYSQAIRRQDRYGGVAGQAALPHLEILPPNMGEYIRFSQTAREIYEDYTDLIEPFGLDESGLDVTGSVGMFDYPMTIAREISGRIKFEPGITYSIGVADNKITAKPGTSITRSLTPLPASSGTTAGR